MIYTIHGFTAGVFTIYLFIYLYIYSGWWYTYPSEKWWSSSVEIIIPNLWKNKIHVPNHQSVCIYYIYLPTRCWYLFINLYIYVMFNIHLSRGFCLTRVYWSSLRVLGFHRIPCKVGGLRCIFMRRPKEKWKKSPCLMEIWSIVLYLGIGIALSIYYIYIYYLYIYIHDIYTIMYVILPTM